MNDIQHSANLGVVNCGGPPATRGEVHCAFSDHDLAVPL